MPDDLRARSSGRPRVVIVGAGFGGLSAARVLGGEAVDVTLVDRHNYHAFLPLLYQVSTAGLDASDIARPVRGIVRGLRNVSFRRATVTAVDWTERVVALDEGPPLPFDHLVVAAGATAAYFGIPGAAERSFPLYTVEDAVALRNQVLSRFEAADADPALVEDGALTFTVVGGGPTGVEVAGALSELFARVLRKDFPHLDVGRARVVLVEMGDDLLPAFRPPSRAHARTTLLARGVEVRTGESVAEVTPTRVRLRSGEEIPSHTLVWAAGVQANPMAAALGVATGRAGRIEVGDDLRIPGHPMAFAIGDIALVPDGTGGVLPGVAQVAMQGGKHVAHEIVRALDGRSPKAFHYFDKGNMATIGRRAAVADLPGGLRLSGTPGWLAWLGLHIVYLIGFRNRISVLIDWAWNYLTWDWGSRVILGRVRATEPLDVG